MTGVKYYEGYHLNNELHGHGEQWDNNPTFNMHYSGMFVKSLWNGEGVLTAEHDIFEGTFVNGLLQGKAKVYDRKTLELKYEADFVDNVRV